MVKVKQLYQKNWRDPWEVETIVKKHTFIYFKKNMVIYENDR